MPLIKVEIWPRVGFKDTEPYAIRTLGEFIDQYEITKLELKYIAKALRHDMSCIIQTPEGNFYSVKEHKE